MVLNIMEYLIHPVSVVATIQFVQPEYNTTESAQGVWTTVSSSSIFTSDVTVRITPLLYSVFVQMGMQLPTVAPQAAASG